ncbi:MAG: RHS repeat-associated core domain-containing protein [Pyrinomonadaceae bacterium]
MRNKKYRKQTFTTLSVFMLVLSLSVVGFTQDRRPDRGIQTANSYSISDIENVNLTNGNLMLNIPLASLPAGRGLGYTVALNYNSKLWNARQEHRTDGIGQGIPGLHYDRELVDVNESGGWYLDSGGYRLNLVNRLGLEAEAPCAEFSGQAAYERNGYVYKVELQMPDGGVREFHPHGASQHLSFPDGFYSIDPNGVQHSYSYTPTAPDEEYPRCSDTHVQGTTSGLNYYTVDGSRLRLFLPYQPAVSMPLKSWTLYLADGRIVENRPAEDPNITQRMTDRNGNKLVWKPATLNGLNGFKIENEVGQYVFVSWYKVIQPGVNGELLETTLQWDDIWVYKRHLATVAPNANYSFTHADLYQNLGVLEKITLPQQSGGREYNFTYHGDYTAPAPNDYTDGIGELQTVTLPSGAGAEYSFALDGDPMGTEMNRAITGSKVTSRVLTYDLEYDATTQEVTETTTYGAGNGVGGACSPDGRCQSQVSAVGGDLAGYAYRISQTGGSVTEKIWVNKRPMGGSVYAQIEPFVKTEFNSVPDPNGNPTLTATKDFDYDQNGNVLEIREYDWVPYSSVPRSSTGEVTEYLPLPRATGLPAGLTLKRRTINTYYYPTPNTLDPGLNNSPNHYSNPASPKLKNLLKSTEIQDGNGTTVSRTELYYDGGMSSPDKGNLTETRTWDSHKGGTFQPYSNPLTTTNSLSTTAVYDQYGNPTLVTDAKGNQTQITYGNIAGPNGNVTDLYPTEVKTAYNTPIQQTVQSEYDFYTGLATRLTGLGNTSTENVVSETIYDALGRPTLSKAAVGTPLEVWTRMEYFDAARRIVTKADLFVKDDGKKVAIQHYDQLGRVRLARTLEDAATEDPYNETHGIKVETRYQTGNPNSYQLSSNPFRAAYAAHATNDPTMGWTRSKAVNTGRHSEVETFSGVALPAPWGGNTNSTGKVQTDIDADRTLVTDQAGKQRISRTNALGQLKDVWEVTASDANTEPITFGALSLHGYKTSYSYDTLNNLITVNQGIQTRSFAYNSLSRLTSATNPESGTINYVYDGAGNLTSKTDARGVKTDYVYDSLNRVTNRNYSLTGSTPPDYQATPNVSYFYDGVNIASGIANSKGKLTKVASSVSTTEYTAFDILGRVTAHKQTTDGNAYTTGYTYNLSGALIEETYPSGRVVKNTLSNDGDLQQVQSQKSGGPLQNYANGFNYNAAGAVTSMRLGNGKWENTTFNSRLQPTQIGLGGSATNTSLLKLNYDYGTTQNNGNVLSQTITVNRSNQTPLVFTQSYVYDSLNRLKSAEEKDASNATTWKQTYTFDRYGNRRFDQTNTTFPTFENPNITNPQIDSANNRFTTGQGWTYDLAGNVITDAEGRSFFYDAENKQKSVSNGSGTIGTYYFDGDGKRVKKVVPNGETTIFVYDAAGKTVAEYSTVVAPVETAKVQYLTNDNLGTPRINTDATGNVVSRSDYMPYGEEIVGLGGRSSTDKYVADDVRQGFTGYENDSETGLDFAQARMYIKRLGRFTTTDPVLMKVARRLDPQRINLYVYVRNNPLNYVDENGEDLELGGKNEEEARQRLELLKKGLKLSDRGSVTFFVGDGKNGYAKGKFYALVDSNHSSQSGNFQAIQQIANNRSETTQLFLGGKQDPIPNVLATQAVSPGSNVLVLVPDNKVLGQDMYVSGQDDPGIVGFTFYSANKPLTDRRFYVRGSNNVVAVANDVSEQMIVETMYHEFRAHLILSNFGNSTTTGDHDPYVVSPTHPVEKEAAAAEGEVRQNFYLTRAPIPKVPAGPICAKEP